MHASGAMPRLRGDTSTGSDLSPYRIQINLPGQNVYCPDFMISGFITDKKKDQSSPAGCKEHSSRNPRSELKPSNSGKRITIKGIIEKYTLQSMPHIATAIRSASVVYGIVNVANCTIECSQMGVA